MYEQIGKMYKEEVGYDPSTGEPVTVLRETQVNIDPQRGWGDKRVTVMPVTANLALAAAATGTLTFTPSRDIEIVDCVIDTYVAAAAAAAHAPGAIHITAITVQGRNLMPGTGFVPIRAFYHDATQRYQMFLNWGACAQSQSVQIALINNDAATAHNVTACLRIIMAD